MRHSAAGIKDYLMGGFTAVIWQHGVNRKRAVYQSVESYQSASEARTAARHEAKVRGLKVK